MTLDRLKKSPLGRILRAGTGRLRRCTCCGCAPDLCCALGPCGYVPNNCPCGGSGQPACTRPVTWSFRVAGTMTWSGNSLLPAYSAPIDVTVSWTANANSCTARTVFRTVEIPPYTLQFAGTQIGMRSSHQAGTSLTTVTTGRWPATMPLAVTGTFRRTHPQGIEAEHSFGLGYSKDTGDWGGYALCIETFLSGSISASGAVMHWDGACALGIAGSLAYSMTREAWTGEVSTLTGNLNIELTVHGGIRACPGGLLGGDDDPLGTPPLGEEP